MFIHSPRVALQSRQRAKAWACAAALAMVCGTASAQSQSPAPEALRNVVHLSAQGQVEVEQDWLEIRLSVTQEGTQAALVQKQLQQTVDAALRTLRPLQQAQDFQLRSGSFGVYPRHNQDSKITGWQGRADLILEGKDFALISQAAAQVKGMTVADMGFTLSKEGAAQVQAQAMAEAVAQFKAKALVLAQQFGFTNFTLREVHVSGQDGVYMPRMRAAVASVPSMDQAAKAESMELQAGKAQVSVGISGSVQMH